MQHAEWVEEVCQTPALNSGRPRPSSTTVIGSASNQAEVSAQRQNDEIYSYKADFKTNFWNDHPD